MDIRFIGEHFHFDEEKKEWIHFLEHLKINMERSRKGLKPIESNGRKYSHLRAALYDKWRNKNEKK